MDPARPHLLTIGSDPGAEDGEHDRPRARVRDLRSPGVRPETTVHRQPVARPDGSVCGYAISVVVRSPAHEDPSDESLDRIARAEYDRLHLGALAGPAIVFVRATTSMLVGSRPLPEPPGNVILELPRHFADRPDAAEHLVRLRAAGVGLAMDDYRPGGRGERLLPLVDFVKVRLDRGDEAAASAIECAHGAGTAVVALPVDTEAAVRFCFAHGVELLQGPLFRRDARPAPRRLSVGELQCVELMRLLAADDVDYAGLTRVIESEPELTIRVLHLINASTFALRARVDSVRRAVVLLGPPKLSALAAASLFRSTDEVRSALWFMLTRALACRALAHSDAAYTVGLLSAVAAQLQIDPADLIARTGVSDDVASAVLTLTGPYGSTLAAVLAHEENDIESVEATGLAQLDVSLAYLDAIADALTTVTLLADIAA